MTDPWWDGPMVGLDLETTSAHPEHARIVQAALVGVGAAHEGQERPVSRHAWLVNPGVEIPEEATEVHGISTEQVRRDGVPLSEAIKPVLASLRACADAGVPVVIQNARYDLTVADRELRRLGIDVDGLFARLLIIDPLVIDRHLDRYRPKRIASHSLTDCCRVWRVPLEGVAHDATFDAIAACRLAWRLVTSGRVIRRSPRTDEERREFIALSQEWAWVRADLPALHGWQQRVAEWEAARLEAYFHRGDPAKDVPPQPGRRCPREWPVVPVGTDWGDLA